MDGMQHIGTTAKAIELYNNEIIIISLVPSLLSFFLLYFHLIYSSEMKYKHKKILLERACGYA